MILRTSDSSNESSRADVPCKMPATYATDGETNKKTMTVVMMYYVMSETSSDHDITGIYSQTHSNPALVP